MAERYPVWFGGYLLLENIGGGAYGTVHFAIRAGGDQLSVVKTLRADLLDSEEAKRRFAHEAKVSLLLTGDAFARVYEAGAVGSVPYLVMEYVPGCLLRKLMTRLEKRGARLTLRDAAVFADCILAGVEELHGTRSKTGAWLDIIHRDLSPTNLIVTRERRVRLIDLGVGRSALTEVKTQTGAIVGSPGFLSPEQVLAGAVDQRTDQFSSAAIIWELFTGERFIPRGHLAPVLSYTVKSPYRALHPLRPALPQALDDVLARGLARDPADRFASVAELRRALAPIFATLDAEEEGTLPFLEVFEPSHTDAQLARIAARAKKIDLGPSEQPTIYATAMTTMSPMTAVTEVERDELSVSASMVELVEPVDTLLRPMPPPRARTRSSRGFALALLVMIAIGGALGFQLSRMTPAPAALPEAQPEPEALPADTAVPEVRATSRPPVAAKAIEVRAPPPPHAAHPPRVTPPPAEMRPAPEPDPASAEMDLEALVRRASRLREQRPQHRAALDAILGELALEARRRNPVRLRAIEARLAELE